MRFARIHVCALACALLLCVAAGCKVQEDPGLAPQDLTPPTGAPAATPTATPEPTTTEESDPLPSDIGQLMNPPEAPATLSPAPEVSPTPSPSPTATQKPTATPKPTAKPTAKPGGSTGDESGQFTDDEDTTGDESGQFGGGDEGTLPPDDGYANLIPEE